MEHRTTVVEFTIGSTRLFDIVQDWAQKWKFSAYEKQANRVIYSKSIRLMKAWLSVEYREGNGRIEAWLSGPGVGPDFEGSAWNGWKIALPQGFGLGPHHIYRKKFNDLLKQMTEKYPHIFMSETVKIEPPAVKTPVKPPLATVFAVYGIFLIIAGILSLLSAASFIYMKSFLDMANHILIRSISDIAVGLLIFASSKAMVKGKGIAIWLYGLGMLLEISSQLITGEKLNYLFITFGIYAIWEIYKITKKKSDSSLTFSEQVD